MDLLTAILTCSLYISDDALVQAIAESTAQNNPFFVIDASVDLTQVDPPPASKTAAEAAARALDILAKGGRPVLGLLQLTPAWVSAFGRELRAAFDPCTNIAIGSAMLSAFDAQCGAALSPTAISKTRGARGASRSAASPSPALRRCILRKYEDAIGLPDFATVTTLELRYQRLRSADVTDAPIFATGSSASWGPDQLLVPIH
jgi:hypothetical protein